MIPFKVALQNIKHLVINLIENVEETIEYCRKQLERPKWRDMPGTWIAIFNIVKNSIFPKLIYKFDTFSIKT